MDEDNSTVHPDSDHPPVKREEDLHPVAWSPEDASRFLSNAIHEAQKPLADALKQRPATTPVLVLIVAILVVASIAIGWILSSQLSKREVEASQARATSDEAIRQQHELKAKSDTLEARLAAAKEEQDRLNQDYLKESESLRGQVAGKRDNEEELRKAQSELVRYRRQNELLKTQISGLEMEKQALARQLDAVKAMAIGEEGHFVEPEAVPTEKPAAPAAATPTPPVSAEPAAPAAPATPAASETPAATPAPTPPVETPAAEPSSTVSATEPPTREAPVVKEEPAASVPAETPAANPAEGGADLNIAPNADAATETVTVDEVGQGRTGTGTLTVGPNGENPPTLYEISKIFEGQSDEYKKNLADAAEGEISVTGETKALAQPDAVEPAAPAEGEAAVEEPKTETAAELESPAEAKAEPAATKEIKIAEPEAATEAPPESKPEAAAEAATDSAAVESAQPAEPEKEAEATPAAEPEKKADENAKGEAI